MMMAQPVTNTSPALGLNNSQNQTNTGQTTVAPLLKVSSSPALGNFLVASNGMTLYMYTKDTANTSNCYGVCATNWPPYNSGATAQAVLPNNISVITRSDGTSQFAFSGKPLYYFASDQKPGDITGDNVGSFHIVKS